MRAALRLRSVGDGLTSLRFAACSGCEASPEPKVSGPDQHRDRGGDDCGHETRARAVDQGRIVRAGRQRAEPRARLPSPERVQAAVALEPGKNPRGEDPGGHTQRHQSQQACQSMHEIRRRRWKERGRRSRRGTGRFRQNATLNPPFLCRYLPSAISYLLVPFCFLRSVVAPPVARPPQCCGDRTATCSGGRVLRRGRSANSRRPAFCLHRVVTRRRLDRVRSRLVPPPLAERGFGVE